MSTLKANATANLIRNLWAYAVIFCGHFPDGAEKFTIEQLEDETSGEWYLRQMLGSANFKAGPAMAFMSGNLCYQIEHHLFPDLPSNRYAEVSQRVRELCDKYDLPYTTGSLGKQYLLAFRTIHKLALPDRFLRRTSDDAPETSSERKFAGITLPSPVTNWSGTEHLHWSIDPATGRRRGLRSAMHEARTVLQEKARHEKEVLREAKRALKEKARHEKEVLREAKRSLKERAKSERSRCAASTGRGGRENNRFHRLKAMRDLPQFRQDLGNLRSRNLRYCNRHGDLGCQGVRAPHRSRCGGTRRGVRRDSAGNRILAW